VSVATSAARFQDISLNPQNLAGQCAKLKCCINFEVNTYVEAIRQLPAKDVHLETKDATYYFFKADALKREITYSTERNSPANTVTLTAAQAFEIIALNKNGVKPDSLKPDEDDKKNASPFGDLLNQDAINRFDKKKKKKKKKNGGGEKKQAAPNGDKPSGGGADNPERRQQRQGKPKRPQQQDGAQQPNGEQQQRREKPQRMEKKTFRPRKPKDAGAPDNSNGQNKPNNE
jgi:hypothetical protein